MIQHLSDRLFSGITYCVTFLGMWFNFDNIKSGILFLGALALLGLQIYLHVLKIRKEKKNK